MDRPPGILLYPARLLWHITKFSPDHKPLIWVSKPPEDYPKKTFDITSLTDYHTVYCSIKTNGIHVGKNLMFEIRIDWLVVHITVLHRAGT
jgi:hypothetical protein